MRHHTRFTTFVAGANLAVTDHHVGVLFVEERVVTPPGQSG